jgi:hypothetical protein
MAVPIVEVAVATSGSDSDPAALPVGAAADRAERVNCGHRPMSSAFSWMSGGGLICIKVSGVS